VVVMHIFRRYPNRYEGVLVTLCENLDTIEDPSAQAAMLWIIGEYSEKIADTETILEESLENFLDDPVEVQLQLLTASVKLFLKNTTEKSQELVQAVLSHATEDCVNPDIRDRGFVYWRLLSNDPDMAKAVVLSERPVIEDDMVVYEPDTLALLIRNISTLSAVFHKPADAFVVGGRAAVDAGYDGDVPEVSEMPAEFTEPRDGSDEEEEEEEERPRKGKKKPANDDADDMLGLGGMGDLLTNSGSTPTHTQTKASDDVDDLMDLLGGSGPSAPAAAPAASAPKGKVTMWLQPEAQTGGLKLGGSFRRSGGKIIMDFQAQNCGQQPLSGFAVQFNKNSFQLQPDSANLALGTLSPGQSGSCSLTLNTGGQMAMQNPLMKLQIAIKNNAGVSYFTCMPPMHVVYVEGAQLDKGEFVKLWQGGVLPQESKMAVEGITATSPPQLSQQLGAHNMFQVEQKSADGGGVIMYFSAKTVNNIPILLEIAVRGRGMAEVTLKYKQAQLVEPFQSDVREILTSQ